MRALPLATFAFVGCGASISTTSGSTSVHDDLTAPSSLAACAHDDDFGESTAILADVRDSYHEMIVCGGLALDFDSAITNVLLNAALGHGGPSAMSYKGNGTFESANHMMVIKTSLVGGGAASFDVLDPNSYLVGLRVNASGGIAGIASSHGWKQALGHAATAELDLQLQGPAPVAALIGLTADELRSGSLATAPERIAKAIATHIAVEDRIDVENTQGKTTIHYVLENPPLPIADLLDSHAINMKLASIEATRHGQSITVTEWTMQFKGDGSKVLDGAIGMDVTGGEFPYHARFNYAHDMSPSIELSCQR